MAMSKITCCIPVHNMDKKHIFLPRLLNSLWSQSFQDFDIVVADNSDDSVMQEICHYFGGIDHFFNPRKGMAQNTNEAIKRSTGSLIKILYMDDFFAHDKALQRIWDNFTGGWLVTSCTHTIDGDDRFNSHRPTFSENIHKVNTIGSPSVLTIENKDPLLFDETLTWMLDADYYKRLYDRYGLPQICNDINVVIGLGEHQATSYLSDELKLEELEYVTQKHG